MRLLIYIVTAIAGVGSLYCFYLVNSLMISDGLVPLQSTVNLGEVRQGTELNAAFVLKNETSTHIIIDEDIHIDCSCANPRLTTAIVGPGQSTRLNVKWKITDIRGPQTSKVYVKYRCSSDRQTPHFISLYMKAIIIPDFDYSPQLIEFHDRQPFVKVVSIYPNQMKEVKAVSAECSHPAFTLEMINGGTGVRVSFDPASWDLRLASTPIVLVETTSPRQPSLKIPVHVVAPALP